MSNTLKLGNGKWATGKDTLLSFSDTNNNYKPLPFSFSRASSGTVINKDGLIETVGSGEPRIDFKDNTKGSLLLEPTRSNLIAYSNGFDNVAWVKLGQGIGSAPIVTPNYAISPDGTLNASRLQCDLNGGNTTNDRSWLYQSISTITGNNTFSLYVKNNSNEDITFSLTNGSSETVVVLSDDKWHRLSTVRSGGGQPRIGLIGGIGASDNADLLIYAAQLEQGSYATSYIPTSGSAVTRVEDTCNNGANEQVINSTEGVLYYEASYIDGSDYNSISISNSSGSEKSRTWYDDTNLIFASYVNNVNQTFISYPIFKNINYKIAIRYKLNDFALYVNGNKATNIVVNLGAVSPQNSYNKLNFNSGDIYNKFYGNVKDVRVYNTALTDQELIALTS